MKELIRNRPSPVTPFQSLHSSPVTPFQSLNSKDRRQEGGEGFVTPGNNNPSTPIARRQKQPWTPKRGILNQWWGVLIQWGDTQTRRDLTPVETTSEKPENCDKWGRKTTLSSIPGAFRVLLFHKEEDVQFCRGRKGEFWYSLSRGMDF